ncbi:MAG: Gfo/Idh/MocA family oxidoreductase [Actinomycetota bacterium]
MSDLRYGIVGTGMMGVEHLHNLAVLDGAVVTALCDPEPTSLATAQALAPAAATYDAVEALAAADPCDAYVVASPNHTHLDVLRPLFDTGKPIMVEKPLCTTVEDCHTVLDLARDHPAPVWMALEYRYMPPVARLLDELALGTIGSVRMAAIREHRFPFLRKVGDWNRLSRNTGGTLVEKCCHFFDLLNLIMDDRPVRVFAAGGQAVNHLDEVYDGERSDLLDHASVTITYAGGQIGTLDLCMFAEATHTQDEVTVIGDRGKMEAHLPDGTFRLGLRGTHDIGSVHAETIPSTAPYEGHHYGSSYWEQERFLRCILDGTPPDVTLADGLASVAVGAAAHRSIETGLPVELTDLLPRNPVAAGQ